MKLKTILFTIITTALLLTPLTQAIYVPVDPVTTMQSNSGQQTTTVTRTVVERSPGLVLNGPAPPTGDEPPSFDAPISQSNSAGAIYADSDGESNGVTNGNGALVSMSVNYQEGIPFPYYNYYSAYCNPYDYYYSSYCYSPYYAYAYYTYPTYYSTYSYYPGYEMYSPSNYYAYPTYYSNPGTVVVNTPQTPQVTCSDGTQAGYCSSSAPNYCANGDLINKASLCGCPEGQTQDPNNQDRCVQATCDDGTPINSCSQNKPQYCTSNQVLVNRPQQCSCPIGEELIGSTCQPLQSTCTLSINPSTIRKGETIVATVNYQDYLRQPRGFIDCGNGQISQLTCTGNQNGLCTTTCTYNTAGISNVNAKAYLNSQFCNSAKIEIINNQNALASQTNTGATSAIHAFDCNTNENLRSATVSITPVHLIGENNGLLTSDVITTNANGIAQIALFQQGLYDVFVEKNGYEKESATINLLNERNQQIEICLNSLNPNNNHDQNNQNNDQNNAGQLIPDVQVIQPIARLAPEPIAPIHSISVRASKTNIKLFPKEKTCLDLTVQNTGNQNEQINVHAQNDELEVTFSQESFELGPNAQNKINTCIQAPQSLNAQQQLEIQFKSNAASATQVIQLNAKQTPQLENQNCLQIDNTKTLQYVPIELVNPSETNNFNVEVHSNAINARPVTPAIYNFKHGETRTVTLAISPKSMNAQTEHATLKLTDEKTGITVLESDMCFTATHQNSGATVGIAQNYLKLQAGQTTSTFLKIRNTGDLPATYTISTTYDETTDDTVTGSEQTDLSGVKITLSTTQVTLAAGEEQNIKVNLATSSDLATATYSIPLYVYNSDELIATPTITTSINEQPETNTLNLHMQVPEIQVDEVQKQITLTIQIQNTENKPRTITAGIQSTPQNWETQVTPAQMQLVEGQYGEFQYTFIATELAPQDTSVTIKLTDELGRENMQTIPIPLKTKQLVTPATGLFTFGENGGIITGLIFILALIGITLFVKAYAARKQLSLNAN